MNETFANNLIAAILISILTLFIFALLSSAVADYAIVRAIAAGARPMQAACAIDIFTNPTVCALAVTENR